jgi:uncharacterized cupredoxin-like copper-binding protein
MDRNLARRLGGTLAAVALVLSACGGGASPGTTTTTATGTPAAGGMTTIDVTLQEFAVIPAADAAPAGDVTFKITNDGPEDVHELVILKTDLGASALPTDENGAVDEAGAGIEVIDEVEDLEVGAAQDLTVNLAAGKYVLLCNIFDETENEAHYKMGMRIDFTVN